jgi:hypothetical protein
MTAEPNSSEEIGESAANDQSDANFPRIEAAPTSDEEDQPEAAPHRGDANQDKKHWLEYATAGFALVAALGSISAVIVGYWQWGIMDKQASIAATQNNISIESQRALFVLKDLRFAYGDPILYQSSHDLVIVLRNVGRHASSIGTMKTAPVFGVRSKSLPEILARSLVPPINFVMPPVAPDADTQIIAKVIRTPPPGMDEDTFMKGFLSGSIPFWVYGVVKYNVGFKDAESGELGFCYLYAPPDTRPANMGQFITCSDYPQYTYTK